MGSAVLLDRALSRFLWLGNHVAVDFVNTQPVVQGEACDLVATFADLIDWLEEADLLQRTAGRHASTRWAKGVEGRRVVAEAHALRSGLRHTLERLRRGMSGGNAAMEAINRLLQQRLGYAQVVRTREGFERRLQLRQDVPVHLLLPLAEAAADLLCNSELSLLKRCENPACVLYYYDTTKNHGRRWCSMSLCGNRSKVAAHYNRRVSRRRG